MEKTKTAVVIGVGPVNGLGGALCKRAVDEGLHVIVAGRTQAKIDAVVATISAAGGNASACVTDTTSEPDIAALFQYAEEIGPVDLAIYNAGNNMPGDIIDMEASYFEHAWRVGCFGGFLFAREALRRMQPRGTGTMLFTGASASLRGKDGFAAFTSAKAGLRTMVQSLAKGYGPKGIHIAQVIIDGGINGDRLRERMPERIAELGEERFVGLQGLADLYLFLYRQPRNAWTHELDVRTHLESF
jgi:NAD(P)-dependent dehydrogenase (short-subunit alcohol dehydrogenase family)